ncbi:putative Rhodanese domain-containing protein [Candidatus Magnetomoraceae bacterium gMMP-15]
MFFIWNILRFKIKLALIFVFIGIMLVITGCENTTEPPAVILSESLNSLSAEELKAMIDSGQKFDLIDIRSIQEYLSGHIPGAVSMPLSQIAYRFRELNQKTPTVVYCRIGVTSNYAVQYLSKLGFLNLYDLRNGYSGWPYAIELSNGINVL